MFNANDMLKTINEKMLKPITSVYIDLPYIQDIYLGSLILQHFNEKEYSYIYSKLPEYLKRYKLSHADYFPQLGETEKDLLDYMKVEKNSYPILMTSPMTSLYSNLALFHRDMTEHTRKVSSVNEIPIIRYLINVYPLSPDEKGLQTIVHRLKVLSPNIVIGFIRKPLSEIQPSLFTDNQIWFIYNLMPLMIPGTPAGDHFSKTFSFRESMIFSPKRVGHPDVLAEFDSYTEQEVSIAYIDTATVMNLYTDFYYLDIDVPTEHSSAK